MFLCVFVSFINLENHEICCVNVSTRDSNIHGGSFHNTEQLSIVVSFTAFYGMIKKYKMYSPVTCLRHAQIRRMTFGHVSPCIV